LEVGKGEVAAVRVGQRERGRCSADERLGGCGLHAPAQGDGCHRAIKANGQHPASLDDAHGRAPHSVFGERALWNIDSTVHRPHSGLMLAARITFAHFSVSSATNFPNSAGVIGMGSPASSARRACNFGSANTAFTAWFSFSTIVGGVPLGAAIPYQMLTS